MLRRQRRDVPDSVPDSSSDASVVDGSYPPHALIPESEAGRRVELACRRSNIVAEEGPHRVLQVDLVAWDRAEAAARPRLTVRSARSR
jgi:hypothetical protein